MFRIALVLASLLLSGCAFPTYIKMHQEYGAGRPQSAVDMFHEEYTLESSDPETLLPLCTSLQMLQEYEKFDQCLSAYREKEDSDMGNSLVATYRAGMYVNFGNYQKAKQLAIKAIEYDDFLPLGPYEWLARIAAKEGKTEEAYEWIEKLDGVKATIFGISIAEDSIGEVKRDQKVRIYLDLKRPDLAEKELKKPIPGKSLGEYIFMGVIDFLESDVDKVANQLAEWTAPKDTEEWRFMMEVQTLWTYGQVAYANENYRDAIQSFRRMMNMPNIQQLRMFYREGLYYLTLAYRDYGEAEKYGHYAALLEQAIARDVAKIPWPDERESFKAKYAL